MKRTSSGVAFVAIWTSLSVAAGALLGAAINLGGALWQGSGFVIWLTLAGLFVGALVGGSSFLIGLGTYSLIRQLKAPRPITRLSIALLAGVGGGLAVLVTAGPYLANPAAVILAIGVGAALVAWLAFAVLESRCGTLTASRS